MRICISRQMSCFTHFSFFGEKQNCAEFFESSGKLLVSFIRSEFLYKSIQYLGYYIIICRKCQVCSESRYCMHLVTC